MKIAFIGLGNMGAPMARNLIKAGHALNLFDLNQAVLKELAELGGSISGSPRDAATSLKPWPPRWAPVAAAARCAAIFSGSIRS